QFIVAGKDIPKTIRVTATPDPLTSSSNTVHVKVPKGVILGLADVSVTRKTPVLQSTSPNVWKVEDRTSESVTIQPNPHILFAANNFDKNVAAVDISENPATGKPRNQVITRIAVGDPAHPGPTRSVAVTPDLTRAYVTVGSGVAVIDVQTLQEVDLNPATATVEHIIEIPGARPYWAVADKDGHYLYVSDTFAGAIYVIDINPTSTTFHTMVKQISVDVAPEGLRGMDVTADGRRLYAAAPLKGGAAQFSSQNYPNGHIVVIDIDTAPGNKTLWTTIAEKTVSQEPYFVKASATDPRLVTFTNRRSDSQGFNVIHATNDAHTNLTITSASLLLGSKLDNFDVNDASAIALLPAGTLGATQTKDYAFVTGWNRIQQDIPSRDPYIAERQTIEEQQSAGLVLGAPVGGNIGVIEDPFGTPKLIAATAGYFLSMPDGLTLSADGKTLYAAFSADNGVRVFDVQKIVTEVTKSANLVKQISRRDGTFNLLEISPLAGLSGIGPLNNPLNASIELAPIGTGRFPQGLAIAEDLIKVDLGFGDAPGVPPTQPAPTSPQIDLVAEPGDTTPLFRWKATYKDQPLPDGWTTKLYLSVFGPKTGLFPPNNLVEIDQYAHRILNGIEGVHPVPFLPEYREFNMNSVPDRALTLGQRYFAGLKVFDAQGNVRDTIVTEFQLKHAPATTPFSSVTVVTHGFETRLDPAYNAVRPPDAFIELAQDIAKSAGGGVVAVYRKSDGEWIREDNTGLSLRELPPEPGQALVLVPNWMQESDISDEGFAEAAADAIFASLTKLNNDLGGKIFGLRTDGAQGPFQPQSPIHFIGHSRGTVVNSEIIQRIGNYLPAVNNIRMTTLDPHDEIQKSNLIDGSTFVSKFTRDLGGLFKVVLPNLGATLKTLFVNPPPATIFYDDLFDPNVQRWSNISFADNYYQKLGSNVFTLTPNGRSLENVEIDVPLSGDSQKSIPARAGFIQGVGNQANVFGITVPGIGGPHSRVWRWYAGTIDLSLSQFEAGKNGEPLFRSLHDGSLAFPFGSLDVPYYTANEYARNGVGPFQFNVPSAVWE
ncbi:MAG: hypothetical protein HOP00_05510, partial [Nitrospira sp.]|nr:hypothetical protein [Nitrospira sp.]